MTGRMFCLSHAEQVSSHPIKSVGNSPKRPFLRFLLSSQQNPALWLPSLLCKYADWSDVFFFFNRMVSWEVFKRDLRDFRLEIPAIQQPYKVNKMLKAILFDYTTAQDADRSIILRLHNIFNLKQIKLFNQTTGMPRSLLQ